MAILTSLFATAAAAATLPTMAALAPDRVGDRGARVGFVEYEAENAVTDGEVIGPSRRFTTLAAEASGRRAVRLGKVGQSVRFTLAAPANAVTVRYAIPDSKDGIGRDATLAVYVGAKRVGALKLTSRYGWFYGRYPFSNHPSDGLAHHFYDEARLLLGRNLTAGAEVRLVVETAAVPWTVIDLADFEQVEPPLKPPPGALSIIRFRADPSGRRDSRLAIARTIAEARRRGVAVFVPPGHFRIDGHVLVDRVTTVGAGPWYSVLQGRGAGIYGIRARAVRLKDFAIIGEVRRRVDRQALAGIGGTMGGGSVLSNLWLQHHKVGVWLDGPFDGLTVRGLRIIDNAADGLNLRGGARHVTIEHNFVRNSGDDGLALWSHRRADADVTIRRNTVIAPILANGIAIYGGRDILVSGNLVADTVTEGGGIHVGQRFAATPLSGRIAIDDNLLVRSGSFDPHWRFGIGALWFYALDRPIDADIAIRRMQIVDSTLPAIQFIGKSIGTVAFDGLRIEGARPAVQVQSGGTASFANVAIEGADSGIARCSEGFTLRLLDNSNSLGNLPVLGCPAISVPRP